MKLYIKRSSPRTLILLPNANPNNPDPKALVFRPTAPSAPAQTHLVAIEYVAFSELGDALDDCVNWGREVIGLLGMIEGGGTADGQSPNRETFLVFATASTDVGCLRRGSSSHAPEPISKLLAISYVSLTTSTWDTLESSNLSTNPYDELTSLARDLSSQSQSPSYNASPNPGPAPLYEHPLASMRKILENGSFFFASPQSAENKGRAGRGWDISSRLEERLRREKGGAKGGVSVEEAEGRGGDEQKGEDGRFVWNAYLLGGLRQFREGLLEEGGERTSFDEAGFLIPVIQGFAGVREISVSTTSGVDVLRLGVVSRLSSKRAGTRFSTRGVDDDGNVANFVETETVLSFQDTTLSYVQIRGSVPLFWEQAGMQSPFGQKLSITRPQAASQPAFDKHFDELVDVYQAVHCVNLLGQGTNEQLLTQAYTSHLRVYTSARPPPPPPLVTMTNFDFHHAVKTSGVESVREEIRRTGGVREALEGFEWTSIQGGEVVEAQKGTMRVNCLDCLDRTNVIAEVLSGTILERFLRSIDPSWLGIPNLWHAHSNLWADNGDYLSKIYAGTGALNTSFTRTGKQTLGGLFSNATKSLGRAYINNFQDPSKQVAIDMMLGLLASQRQIEVYDPLSDQLKQTLSVRASEFSSTREMTIFAGTWNLNGKAPSESLLPWLFPSGNTEEPDVFSIAFQEIVPLTAQQIIATDPEKLRIWERFIQQTFANRPNAKSNYVMLRSEQLVGTALVVMIKEELTGAVRNVEGASKKTGFRGLSGNKGGCAIRFSLHDTTVCFVTAHFAAGHLNVSERNADYHTILFSLRFSRGKSIGNHDIVLFSGDFNYRVGLDNEEVRRRAESDDLGPLLEADQLRIAMSRGEVFGEFTEGEIDFRPTYKYDNGYDTYDTSEKSRIPAWTDRVLFRSSAPFRQLHYDRAVLRTSDHRPVSSLFQASIALIDHAKKAALSREIKASLLSGSSKNGKSESLLNGSMMEESDLGEKNGLPPPSSDKAQWWNGDEEEGLAQIAALENSKAGTGNPWATS